MPTDYFDDRDIWDIRDRIQELENKVRALENAAKGNIPEMLQKEIFLKGEGQAWLERNRDKLGQNDSVSEFIEAHGLMPTSVLEVGCADGWRLEKLEKKYRRCQIAGIDPSGAREWIARGTADDLKSFFGDGEFDLVIYGFCLYLCDPQDYFKIAAEGDRVLKDGGHILIHDFYIDDFGDEHDTKTPYEHKKGVWSYRVYWPSLWCGMPFYREVDQKKINDDEVWLLKKDLANAFQVRSTSEVHVSSCA